MKRIKYIIIAVAICVATSCSTKSDYETEKAEFASEQAELAKERQELAKERVKLRKEYEELRQEYLREKREFQRTVRKERKSRHKKVRQLQLQSLTPFQAKSVHLPFGQQAIKGKNKNSCPYQC